MAAAADRCTRQDIQFHTHGGAASVRSRSTWLNQACARVPWTAHHRIPSTSSTTAQGFGAYDQRGGPGEGHRTKPVT